MVPVSLHAHVHLMHHNNESSFSSGFVHFFKGNIVYKFDANSKRVVSTIPANDLLECNKADNNEILKYWQTGAN